MNEHEKGTFDEGAEGVLDDIAEALHCEYAHNLEGVRKVLERHFGPLIEERRQLIARLQEIATADQPVLLDLMTATIEVQTLRAALSKAQAKEHSPTCMKGCCYAV